MAELGVLTQIQDCLQPTVQKGRWEKNRNVLYLVQFHKEVVFTEQVHSIISFMDTMFCSLLSRKNMKLQMHPHRNLVLFFKHT